MAATTDVLAALFPAASFVEHAERFADARSVAEEHFQPPTLRPALLRLDAAEQFIGIRASVDAGSQVSPASWFPSCLTSGPGTAPSALSRSRFSASTLTRGSPKIPNCRPSTRCSTSPADGVGGYAAHLRHAIHLGESGSRTDVGVEAARRGSQEVSRYGTRVSRILLPEFLRIV